MSKRIDNRWLWFAGLVVSGLLMGTAVLATAQDQQPAYKTETKQSPKDDKGKPVFDAEEKLPQEGERRREGSLLKAQIGRFEITGDRVTFYPSDNEEEQFRVLENLALERVVRALTETHTRRKWNVSGLITEFQGTNFLLVHRAFLTSNATVKKPTR